MFAGGLVQVSPSGSPIGLLHGLDGRAEGAVDARLFPTAVQDEQIAAAHGQWPRAGSRARGSLGTVPIFVRRKWDCPLPEPPARQRLPGGVFQVDRSPRAVRGGIGKAEPAGRLVVDERLPPHGLPVLLREADFQADAGLVRQAAGHQVQVDDVPDRAVHWRAPPPSGPGTIAPVPRCCDAAARGVAGRPAGGRSRPKGPSSTSPIDGRATATSSPSA